MTKNNTTQNILRQLAHFPRKTKTKQKKHHPIYNITDQKHLKKNF